MKVGFNLYRHLLTPDNFQFARQSGATHAIVHMVDYSGGQPSHAEPESLRSHVRTAANGDSDLWSLAELFDIVRMANDAGLEVHAIENFDPAHWYDILLDGPRKHSQIKNLKLLINRVGEAGIPVVGYNFSLAGICGRVMGPFARGQAQSFGMNGPFDDPLPPGMIWNTRYLMEGDIGCDVSPAATCTSEQLWDRLRWFLDEILPVAEASGVVLAAHADDPPLPMMRGTPRLMYRPEDCDTLLGLNNSRANQIDLCLGSVAQMLNADVYETTDRLTRQNKVAYIHFRNVIGKVPYAREVFPDEGDIDLLRIFQILRKNRFDGVVVPDNTPAMQCSAPWHAGMAFTVGYMKGLLNA
ncbi:MAG: mannonate dehydratase [Verrucomicrobia bacterium]|nr:mannonate dehydratase [Verrucomicrobiota bacterium]